jgi:microsomal dipeptidase-like Zn-dependent dipeptidase
MPLPFSFRMYNHNHGGIQATTKIRRGCAVKSRLLRIRQLLLFFLFALSLGVSVNCFAQCGGNGQRACCNGDGEFSNRGLACNSGLAYSTAQGCIDPNGCSCSGGIIKSEQSVGMCYQPASCGGEGQRACCNGAGEFSNDGLGCNAGLVQIPGGCGPGDPACVCGGPGTNGFFPAEYALGNCVQPSACGGEGQRACCNGLTEFSNNGTACNSGLTEVPGCSGDCTCGGSTSIGEPDGNSCTSLPIAKIAEPAANATPAPNETGLIGSPGSWTLLQESLPAGPECPPTGLCGFSDLHVHMFANLAHGGATLAGEAWDPNGVNAALGEDYGSSLALVDKNGHGKPKVDGSGGGPNCPLYMIASGLCKDQVLYHGDHTAFDTVTGGGTNDGAAANFGAPLFNGWPLWSSTIHQQVYYKWLERAWLGGLRLIVMDAVTNEALCKSGTKVAGTDCALSMTAIDAQLQAAKDFQTFLDSQYGGPGKGWFRIVTTPGQAESAIQEGKLAVVLGIEVDNLFNCHFQNASGQPLNGEGPACTDTYVQQQLQKYFGMGVRHIFPIHNFDNAYGAPAAWQDAINAGNRAGEGVFWAADNCTDPGYGFSLDATTDGLLYLAGFGGNSFPVYPTFTSGSCHDAPGLTSLGSSLVQQAMNMGMIIDVDHMSIHAFNDTINLANRQSPVYAGIAATHVQFFDLYSQSYGGRFGRHERMRTQEQLQKIKDVGGMIAAMLKDDTQDTGDKGWCLPQGNCPFGALTLWPAQATAYTSYPQSCSYSTTEWAQAYLYGVKAMDGSPVAMGSDFNGIAGHVGPRFGNGACAGSAAQRAQQERANNRLVYPFTIPGFGTFDRQVSGQKTYDFNVDGLAHIGLLPDMVADLKNIGVTDQQLQPLFGSAQAYIHMWSAVFRAAAPDVSLSGVPATSAYKSSFTVTTDNHGTTTSVPTITVVPANVCSINGDVVTMTSGTGTCSVTATWAADGDYAKASITKMADATKILPTVTFTGVPATAPYGSRFEVSATTNASTVAVITTTTDSVCSVNGKTVTITSGTGACSLRASWDADNNYSSAQLARTTSTLKFTPTVELSVNGSRTTVVAVGDNVTFVARIHAASPTSLPPDGSITVSDSTNGNIRYGSAPITKDPNSNDGRATITNAAIPAGSYVLVATYGGDNQGKYYNGAQSNTVSLLVQTRLGQSPLPSLAINATSGAHHGRSLLVLLTVTNQGTAPAVGITLRHIAVRSLSGDERIELLAPIPPVMIDNLKPGTSTVLTLKLEVPARVKKLRLDERGRFRDAQGKPYEFSLEQVLSPDGTRSVGTE